MTSGGHCEAVNLRFDVNDLLRIGLEPGHINFNVKMADAIIIVRILLMLTYKVQTHLLTMASSGMASKCFAVIISLFPVVVTNTLARGAASSIVVTS